MRRHRAIVLVGCLLFGASCSSSDSSSEVTAPATSTSPAAPTTPSDGAPATTDVSPAEFDAPGATGAEQLAALHADPEVSPLEVAVAEWSAFGTQLPGALRIKSDETLFPSGSHALAEIDAGYDQLTSEQQEAFDRQLLALFDPDVAIDRFSLFDDGSTTGDDEEAAGGARPLGFAAPSSPAPPEVRDAVRALAETLRTALGGPSMKIWVEIHPAGAFGDALAKNITLNVLSPARIALLAAGEDIDCLMRITDVDMTSSEVRGVFVHELVHCWQAYQLGAATDRESAVARQNAMDDWAKEGMAAYYGEQVGGTTRFNAEWWGGYLGVSLDADNSWTPYPRPPDTYDAIGLWSRIAEGSDIVQAMKDTLAVAPDDAAMYAAATGRLGAGASWIAAGVVQRPEWGPGWTATGPGMPATARPSRSVEVAPLGRTIESVGAAMQRTTEWSVATVDGATGSVMTLFGDGGGVARVGDTDFVIPPGATATDDWCIGACLCPDGTSPFAADHTLASPVELTSALVGTAESGSSLLVEVVEFDADDEVWACEAEPEPEPEPEPDLGAPSGGLVGTWVANPDSVASMMEQASLWGEPGDGGLDVAGASGDVLITFAEDGTGTLVWDRVMIFFNDTSFREISISGAGSFQWGVGAGDIRISGTQFAFDVTSSALGGAPLTITSDDVPAGGVTTLSGAVAGDQLTISSSDGTAGQVFFPVSWRRISDDST